MTGRRAPPGFDASRFALRSLEGGFEEVRDVFAAAQGGVSNYFCSSLGNGMTCTIHSGGGDEIRVPVVLSIRGRVDLAANEFFNEGQFGNNAFAGKGYGEIVFEYIAKKLGGPI